MSPSTVSPSRFRWAALLWFLPAALVLLVLGIWTQVPGWVVGLWVAVPLMFGVAIAAFSGRRTTVADGAYAITSQGARSEGRLSVQVPVEQVPAAVHGAVEGLPRFTIVEISPSEAKLKARMNFWTWGERITVRFHCADPHRTVIEALCEPALRTTMIDYGQGRRDLQAILSAIEGRLTEANPVS